MTSSEIDQLRATDPIALQKMIDEIDAVPPSFDAGGQIKYKNGRLIGGSEQIKYKNGVLQS